MSPQDLAYHGGTLELDGSGELYLNADTGISAGFKDQLDAIKGQPRIIPIFRSINGTGNNAYYTIVGWAGIRILYVQLTGPMNAKHLIVQPALVTTRGGIPADEGAEPTHFVYSPLLVQ